MEKNIALSQEHLVRKEKVDQLLQEGVDAWPEHKPVSHTTSQARLFYQETASEQKLTVAGRILSKRQHGKTAFIDIHDRDGRLQLYIKTTELTERETKLLTHMLDLGDVIWAEGTMFTTKMGEITLHVTNLALLSKCLHPLPEKYHGLTDVEQRYRHRYLDLMSNEDTKKRFIARSSIIQAIRMALLQQSFLEVETPMLQTIPGGAAARPFVTKHNAYNIDLYLRIAPELYLKRLVVGGLERVFEINRNFRNEGVSTRHNPEFTMMECYMAHADYRDGMNLAEHLIKQAAHALYEDISALAYGEHRLNFDQPFARMTIHESLTLVGKLAPEHITKEAIDATLQSHGCEEALTKSYGEKILALFEACVEPHLIQPTFILDYPVEVSPLAKRHPHNTDLTARYELFVAGMELANCFSELNNPFDQADRLRTQAAARTAGDEEAHYFDEDFVLSLEYGLPPTMGLGIGIDRLVMLLTNTPSIKDVILFPTMKPRHS